MVEEEETEEDAATEATESESRDIDIEDQGQAVDAGTEVDPNVESVDVDDELGPEGEGAREATQKAGEAPTEVVDEGETDREDE